MLRNFLRSLRMANICSSVSSFTSTDGAGEAAAEEEEEEEEDDEAEDETEEGAAAAEDRGANPPRGATALPSPIVPIEGSPPALAIGPPPAPRLILAAPLRLPPPSGGRAALLFQVNCLLRAG